MRGLIFSEPMVKAWLEGRKTVTRRLMKPQPTYFKLGPPIFVLQNGKVKDIKAPYRPGETVYITETWRETWCSGSPSKGYEVGIEYRATWTGSRDPGGKTAKVPEMHYGYKVTKKGRPAWKSPRFMPEWAARSHALIVSVRPERIQEITDDDAEKEGMEYLFESGWHRPDCRRWSPVYDDHGVCIEQGGCSCGDYSDAESYRFVWESFHPGSWDRNDFVWRIELKLGC